jgi:hypothetical protein
VHKHGMVFLAVVIITQLCNENGEKLFMKNRYHFDKPNGNDGQDEYRLIASTTAIDMVSKRDCHIITTLLLPLL